jgi:hypothetical protein
MGVKQLDFYFITAIFSFYNLYGTQIFKIPRIFINIQVQHCRGLGLTVDGIYSVG